jgi:hypothetical protein
MAATPSINEIAHRFAGALDREDYEAARAMLTPDCRYEGRTGTVVGPDAIVSSYRHHSATARRLFDTVEYRSEPQRIDDDTACVRFFDCISKHGQTHVYQCQQRLQLRSDGLIASIRHEELPGARERLLEFCAACGVTLDDGTDNHTT